MPRALSSQPHAYVYVIGYRAGLVKVGFSLWPERRVAQLSAFYGIRLTLLGDVRVARGDVCGVERLAHARMADKRVEDEWFSVSAQEALGIVVMAGLDYERGIRVIRAPKGPGLPIRTTEDLLRRLEEWRAKQRPIPNKSEAARMLIEMALEAQGRTDKPSSG